MINGPAVIIHGRVRELGNDVSCFTRDGNLAREFGRRIDVGMVGINGSIA